MDNEEQQPQQLSPKEQKKQTAEQNGAELAKTGAKLAADAYAPGVGGKVVDLASKTPMGNALLNQAGKSMAKNPFAKKALSSPMASQASNAMNMASGGMPGSKGATPGMSGGASQGPSTTPKGAIPSSSSPKGSSGTEPKQGLSSNSPMKSTGLGGLGSSLLTSKLNSKPKEDQSGMEKAAGTAMKIKKYWPIISAVAPIVGYLILGILVIILVMIPIMFVRDNIESIKTGFTTGLEKLMNFTTGKGFNTNEDAFFITLQKEYDRYEKFNFKTGEFDVPMIASAIHYSRMTDPDVYENAGNQDDSFGDSKNPLVDTDATKAFYKVAEDKLGSAFSLIVTNKKLIGHLINSRFQTICVQVPSGWNILNPSSWENAGETAKMVLEDFIVHLKAIVEDTTNDYFKSVNVLNYIDLIMAYGKMEQSFFNERVYSFFSGLEDTLKDNVVTDFIDMMTSSDINLSCEDLVPDEDGFISVAIPVIWKYIDYKKFEKYLVEYYVPSTYYSKHTNVFQCIGKGTLKPYKCLDEELQGNVRYMAREIMDQKHAYDYLMSSKSSITTEYIPGMSTFPIPLGSGEDWKKYVSRGYAKGTAACYVNGKYTGKDNCDHLAIDFGSNVYHGMPIYAVADGDVLAATWAGSYGNMVKIGHDTNDDGKYEYYSLYAHMSKILVNPGDKIGGGQQIGEMGSTGNSSGTHLHFEIRDANDKPIDPTPILNGILSGNSVLNSGLDGAVTCNKYSTTEISQLNMQLKSAVTSAGQATRAGIVAASNFLTSKLPKIPYFWGGKSNKQGINPQWGCKTSIGAEGSDVQPLGSSWPYGMDCSGFVSWALINGGFKNVAAGARAQGNMGTKVSFSDGISQAKPGDLAWKDGHIGLILSISGNYYTIAQEGGASTGLYVKQIHKDAKNFTHVVLMDSFYNNENNKVK